MQNRSPLLSARVLMPVLFVALDAIFLYWVWRRFPNWGIWDWDYQQTLLEAARRSIVEYGQLPLWNPWLGGGVTLIGHPLGRTFNPSFLPILVFGTVTGIKLCIFIYMMIGQAGMYRLARHHELDRTASFLAAALFSFGGYYVQHVTHGHFEWIAYAWLPFVVIAIERSARSMRLRTIAGGGVFLGLLFLDGGPYQVFFAPLFMGIYALLISLKHGTVRPLAACYFVVLIAAGLAAVQIFPVAETLGQYPRRTIVDRNFYGAPFEPSAWQMLFQGFVSRNQGHDPRAWMPFVINVGCYVGVLPLLMAGFSLLRDFRRTWTLAAALLASLWVYLGAAAPFNAWAWLHRMPGFQSLQVPTRFKPFLLLTLALLAAHGLQRVKPSNRHGLKWMLMPVALVTVITADLYLVNAPVLRFAFTVEPMLVEPRDTFSNYQRSPFREHYGPTLGPYPLMDEVIPIGTFPTTLENAGVINARKDFEYPRDALAHDDPRYPGREAWAVDPRTTIERVGITPNRITVTTAGNGSRIVVNQNHDAGWRVEGTGAPVESHGGLISLEIPPGDHQTTLVYRPRSFFWGAGVSVVSLLLVSVMCLRGRRTGRGTTTVDRSAGAYCGIAVLAVAPLGPALLINYVSSHTSRARATSLAQRAEQLGNDNQWRESAAAWQSASQLDPQNHNHLVGLAQAYVRLDRPEKAVQSYGAAIALHQNDVAAHYRLGMLLSRLNRLDNAIEHLRLAVRCHGPQHAKTPPDLARMLLDLAIMLANAGRIDESIEACKRFVQIQPLVASGWHRLAELLAKRGREVEAITLEAWVLSTHPNDKVRNGPRAVELAVRACQLTDFKDLSALDSLAAAYAEIGRFDQARKWVDTLIALAEKHGHGALADRVARRAALYRNNQPYRQHTDPQAH